MERILLAALLWNVIHHCLTSAIVKRDTVFSLYPAHVWHGEVKARQIESGGFSLCADLGWGLAEADEVCRDLGFENGAMQFGTKEFKAKAQTSAKCIFVPEGSFCQTNDDPCSLGAWVSCQFPGYVGCYPFDPNAPSFVTYERLRGDIDEMSIEACTSICNTNTLNAYDYAGLEDGSRCYCGNNAPIATAESDRNSCLKPCNDDERQSCGGVGHIAIYESKLGVCGGTFSIREDEFYIASPGFPGKYRPSTRCIWSYSTPKFSDTVVTVFGMDFTEAESLKLISYETGSSNWTSERVFTSTGQNDVSRGVFSFDIQPNTINAGIVIIFNVSGNSGGAKQFLLSFQLANVTYITTDSTAIDPSAVATTKKFNSGHSLIASRYIKVFPFVLALTLFLRDWPSFS